MGEISTVGVLAFRQPHTVARVACNPVVLQRRSHRHLLVLRRLCGLCESRAALRAELGRRACLRAAGPTEQPRCGQSTDTIPAGVHVSIFHRWSAMSGISPCHVRHEVSRLSYVVSIETRFGWRSLSYPVRPRPAPVPANALSVGMRLATSASAAPAGWPCRWLWCSSRDDPGPWTGRG